MGSRPIVGSGTGIERSVERSPIRGSAHASRPRRPCPLAVASRWLPGSPASGPRLPGPTVIAEAAPPVAEAPDQTRPTTRRSRARPLFRANRPLRVRPGAADREKQAEAADAGDGDEGGARRRASASRELRRLGTTEYDLALVERRAEVARRYLVELRGHGREDGHHQLRRGAPAVAGPRRRVARAEPPRRRRAALHALQRHRSIAGALGHRKSPDGASPGKVGSSWPSRFTDPAPLFRSTCSTPSARSPGWRRRAAWCCWGRAASVRAGESPGTEIRAARRHQ